MLVNKFRINDNQKNDYFNFIVFKEIDLDKD